MSDPINNVRGWNLDSSYARLPQALFQPAKPDPGPNPKLIFYNDALGVELGLKADSASPEDLAHLFSGTQLPPQATPIAQAYAGHQFGNLSMLGDGRALLWGEQITPQGKRVDLQFKGSGPTPFSRRGDGKAALGPMLREYIISEAMHSLGIPTTRSLAVITTGETIYRDRPLQGAILTRVASSHLRVGTFQYAALTQDKTLLQTLLNYTLERHYPQLISSSRSATDFLTAVMMRQIDLIIDWLRVGFIHGVMNTDNMAISGETIDYGPCAFMDIYDPKTVFSSIDRHGRYAFNQQPLIAKWNLARLAEALLPLMEEHPETAITVAEQIINSFDDLFNAKWLQMMGQKLGLDQATGADLDLIQQYLKLLQTHQLDYTNSFRNLIKVAEAQVPTSSIPEMHDWEQQWLQRIQQNSQTIEKSIYRMKSTNPSVIPRNHKVEEALTAAESGDITPTKELLKVLSTPHEDLPESSPYRHADSAASEGYMTYCGT